MAGAAQKFDKLDLPASVRRAEMEARREMAIKEVAAELFGRGATKHQVTKRIFRHLIPDDGQGDPARYQLALKRVKGWLKELGFRSRIYDYSVIQLDLESPAILQGVARKARGGRVDAAKLALEITGRHSSKPDVQPAQVALVIGDGLPRPKSVSASIDGEVTEVQLALPDGQDE